MIRIVLLPTAAVVLCVITGCSTTRLPVESVTTSYQTFIAARPGIDLATTSSIRQECLWGVLAAECSQGLQKAFSYERLRDNVQDGLTERLLPQSKKKPIRIRLRRNRIELVYKF